MLFCRTCSRGKWIVVMVWRDVVITTTSHRREQSIVQFSSGCETFRLKFVDVNREQFGQRELLREREGDGKQHLLLDDGGRRWNGNVGHHEIFIKSLVRAIKLHYAFYSQSALISNEIWSLWRQRQRWGDVETSLKRITFNFPFWKCSGDSRKRNPMVRDSSFVVWFRPTLYLIMSSGCACEAEESEQEIKWRSRSSTNEENKLRRTKKVNHKQNELHKNGRENGRGRKGCKQRSERQSLFNTADAFSMALSSMSSSSSSLASPNCMHDGTSISHCSGRTLKNWW